MTRDKSIGYLLGVLSYPKSQAFGFIEVFFHYANQQKDLFLTSFKKLSSFNRIVHPDLGNLLELSQISSSYPPRLASQTIALDEATKSEISSFFNR
nr:hypothetical transcript [Hymenolepis microstoma]